MTTTQCEQAIRRYLHSLPDDFEFHHSGNAWPLSTPSTMPDGQGVEIELQASPGNRILISDMETSINYLYVNGLTLSQALTAKCRQIARQHGASLQRNELTVHAKPESVAATVHRAVEAILAVSKLTQELRTATNTPFEEHAE